MDYLKEIHSEVRLLRIALEALVKAARGSTTRVVQLPSRPRYPTGEPPEAVLDDEDPGYPDQYEMIS